MKEDVLILHNSVICLSCGEKLISRYNHDFKSCSCENEAFVDGGLNLFSRFGAKDLSKIQRFVITTKDKFEEQRFYFEHGIYGKDGKQPLTFIKLKDLETSHLKAILKYNKEDNPYNKVYQKELKFRGK